MVYQFSRTLTLLLLIGMACVGARAEGASGDPSAAPALAARPERGGIAQVERHIAGLQRRLKITSAQQPQWEAFTAVMRQNAAHMEARQRDRAGRGASTALEDMRSYAEGARAHADDVQRLVPAFDALYAAMTAEQKAVADRTFHEFQERSGRARVRQP